ncbi:membrane-bound lytic murein transglycosylase B [Nocardioides thalensis]|uniref:Membrane-bound lytic murein transglycosylase B n=1 Tax=Nocardioides thalensis TaxID=1914755 RepID=A0A853BWS7_9ACTN|nr:lytic murein transglycosylase [Nocardioides thalensis]NYI99523.1 membrane-bound lytic murein transglycosylase B [Nocardioides thalensis]
MSTKRLGKVQRAATIVPLALLSIAWTASVYGIGGVTAPISAAEEPVDDTISVPTDEMDEPASVTNPNPGSVRGGEIVNAASTNDIPSSALAAYQRAETVINAADKSCNVTWQLIAAIGRVESNHGRSGGNVLDDDGVARPGLYGNPLNGTKGTTAISDTDAGQLDEDTRWDRAVGPMQFIPSTWQVVGVDADNDSERNPQDIDDAALASAVYLCSGDDDLSTLTGQRSAVYRYNHSQTYVDLVLSIMEAYLEGDFQTIPDNTMAGDYIYPDLPDYGDYYGGGGGGSSDDNNEEFEGEGDNGGGDGIDPDGDSDGENPDGENPDGENPDGEDPDGDNGGGGGGLLDPDNNNAPDTGTDLDEPIENLVDGLLGPLDATLVNVSCTLAYPLNAEMRQKCIASYQ